MLGWIEYAIDCVCGIGALFAILFSFVFTAAIVIGGMIDAMKPKKP